MCAQLSAVSSPCDCNSKNKLGSKTDCKMRKKRVSFFERVKIREIRPPYNSSDEFSLMSDEDFDDSEVEYHMDLEKDCGDGDDIDHPESMISMTRSNKFGTGYSSCSNNHIVDFSGKVYTSVSPTSFRRSSPLQIIPSKFLLLPKTDRWQSQPQSQSSPVHRRRVSKIVGTKVPEDDTTTDSTISSASLTSEENDHDDAEATALGLSSANPPPPPIPPSPPRESPSTERFRVTNRKRQGRIKEDHRINQCFRPHSSGIRMSPPRRVSSTESLTSRAMYLRSNCHPEPSFTRERRIPGNHKNGYNNSGSGSGSGSSLCKSRRKTTSAPSLTWFKSRSRKPNQPSLAASRNSTFNLKPCSQNNKKLPSRSMTLLDTIISDSSKSLGNSASSRDTVTTACSEEEEQQSEACCSHSDIESNDDDEEESLHREDDPSSSESTPEKPSSLSSLLSSESSSSRRSLLQRGIGSLRNLTGKSPRSKKGKQGDISLATHPPDVVVPSSTPSSVCTRTGWEKVSWLPDGCKSVKREVVRNDLPPVRPKRTTSVRALNIDDS